MSARTAHHPPLGPRTPTRRAARPPVVDASPPPLLLATPTGQLQIPGITAPGAAYQAANHAARNPGSQPLVSLELSTRAETNAALQAGHALGPCTRPFGVRWLRLSVMGAPVGYTVLASTVSASVDKATGLHRRNVVELARLYSTDPAWTRVLLRATREIAPEIWANPGYGGNAQWPIQALIAYSLPTPGAGGQIYRTDGFQKLRDCAPWSGTGTWSTSKPQISGPYAAHGLTKGLWVHRYPTP